MLTEGNANMGVVIACDPSAIPIEMREKWVETGKYVYSAVQEVQDMPDGYRFRLFPDSVLLLKVAEYIANERLCCGFLHFTLEVEANGGPFWLGLAGGEGVKEYMWSIFGANGLLNEDIVKMSGL